MFKQVIAFTFSILLGSSSAMAETEHVDESKIYKILLPVEWQQFSSSGLFHGSPVDLKDKFIHLSARAQVDGVLERHYQNSTTVYIVEFNSQTFGTHLKWEPASSGELYPHVYGMPLKFSEVSDVEIRCLISSSEE